jgi:hypothetical protein
MSKTPHVVLFNFTPRPLETMLLAFRVMHGEIPDSLDGLGGVSGQLQKEFPEYLAAEPLTGGIQEFVLTNWIFRNCSRAFQQQLTRTRTAAYSCQSLRVVGKEGFATAGGYHTPPDVKDPMAYEQSMLKLEEMYSHLIQRGENVQVARGLLPLNIQSTVTMAINFRNLSTFLSSRLCLMAQGEIQTVGALMIEEVCLKMGEMFRPMFRKPCEHVGFCPHAEGCGFKPKLETVEGKYTQAIKDFVKS